jgi:MFS family permease
MSAIGTASGPSIGGLMITRFAPGSVFLILVPLGILNFLLVKLCLPNKDRKTDSTLIPLLSLLNSAMTNKLFLNVTVSTVMMSTLVVGPFFLSKTLGLGPMEVGALMSISPLLSIISGLPAGRLVDRFGAQRVTLAGLTALVMGAVGMATLPLYFGIPGYVFSGLILSPGYQMFQAANNTNVIKACAIEQRGLVSGLLNLSRNLGMILGASAMAGIYASYGMQNTFLTAAGLLAVALGVAVRTCGLAEKNRCIVRV